MRELFAQVGGQPQGRAISERLTHAHLLISVESVEMKRNLRGEQDARGVVDVRSHDHKTIELGDVYTRPSSLSKSN